MPFNEIDEFDDLSIGDLTDLLSRTSAGDQRKREVALDSQAEGIVVRWQARFDDWFVVYTFTVGERRYWFAWESPFDEAHRGPDDPMWYDVIRRGTRFEVRYQASDRTQHLARFGDHQLQGRFLQVRSTLREAFIAALPAGDYPTLTTLVDQIRTIEHDDLTFLLVRALLEPLSKRYKWNSDG